MAKVAVEGVLGEVEVEGVVGEVKVVVEVMKFVQIFVQKVNMVEMMKAVIAVPVVVWQSKSQV